MRQLIWKEWHEQSWKLVFGCIVLSAFALIGLRTRIILDQEMVLWVCMPAMVLLPLLAVTGLVPAERSDDTLEALASLPVSMRQICSAKMLTGLCLSIGPLLSALAVSVAVAGAREIESASMVGIYGRSILTAAALFFWMFALTIRLPSEARAAMVSIGVLMCWGMMTVGIWQMKSFLLDSISPFSFALSWTNIDHGIEAPLLVNVLVQMLIAAVLWLWASRAIAKGTNSVE